MADDEAQEAIREAYQAYYRRLVATLYGLTADYAEAQDLVQEAYARALARPKTFLDVADPEAWLRTVAVNLARTRWRRRRLLDTMIRTGRVTPTPESVPGADPTRVLLVAALAKLSRPTRETIVLHHIADMSVQEVAEQLSIPVGTVKARLSRGRALLAELLHDGAPTVTPGRSPRPATGRVRPGRVAPAPRGAGILPVEADGTPVGSAGQRADELVASGHASAYPDAGGIGPDAGGIGPDAGGLGPQRIGDPDDAFADIEVGNAVVGDGLDRLLDGTKLPAEGLVTVRGASAMSEPDFGALRSAVEQHTRLPEFDSVAKRGRRRSRRRRLATTLWSLAAMIVCLPGLAYIGLVLASNADRPGVVQVAIANGGDDNPTNVTITLPAPTGVVTTRLVAAGGVDMAHAYGLIDACRDGACSLQLVSLGTDASTQRIGLLRSEPSDTLAGARVVALDQTDVIVTAEVGNSIGPVASTLNLGSIFATKRPTTSIEPVQTMALGKIQAVRGGDGEIRAIPHQPKLASINLASSVDGWWVTGDDPGTGELAVAVSHDQGATWHTSDLGVVPETGAQPVLATADGTNVYVLVRSAGQMLLIRSTDGGQIWAAPIPEAAWGGSGGYGLITPADGSLGVWLADDTGAVIFRRSIDNGATFTLVTGRGAPVGRVVTIPGGYVTLGGHPTISVDAHTWEPITIPFVPPN